jgi:hypothetical protein
MTNRDVLQNLTTQVELELADLPIAVVEAFSETVGYLEIRLSIFALCRNSCGF